MKFLLASLKTLTHSKNCSESRTKFCSGLPLLSDFYQWINCTFIAGFRNTFQDQRRASEQLLAIKKLPEEGFWKEFHN
jgi:hypothetical protein